MGPRGEVGKGLSQARQRKLAQIEREGRERVAAQLRRQQEAQTAAEAEDRRRIASVLAACQRATA